MYCFTGGKTGGHIYPLINFIKATKIKSIYVGYKDFLEEKVCNQNNIKFIGLNYKKGMINIFKCINELDKKLEKYNIEGVISTGGFVSLPLIIYAIKNKIPIYLYEENTILGRFNKLMYPFCKKMFLTYPIKRMKKKYKVVGLPMALKPSFIAYKYDFLIIGGSLGSKPLCNLALKLSNNYNVLLIAGRYYDEYKNKVNSIKYSNSIYELITASKVVITRGGAMSTYEVMYINRPLIIVPSEKTKGNHQIKNATFLSENKCAIMIRENDLFRINSIASKLLNDNHYKDKMLKNQKELIVIDSCEKILEEIK